MCATVKRCAFFSTQRIKPVLTAGPKLEWHIIVSLWTVFIFPMKMILVAQNLWCGWTKSTYKERGKKKNGIMWEKFPSGGPPPSSLGIFTFFYRFFCHFISPWIGKKQRKIWSGFGSDLALFDISIWYIDCRYIDTFEKYRYRYRYRYGHFWKYRYR